MDRFSSTNKVYTFLTSSTAIFRNNTFLKILLSSHYKKIRKKKNNLLVLLSYYEQRVCGNLYLHFARVHTFFENRYPVYYLFNCNSDDSTRSAALLQMLIAKNEAHHVRFIGATDFNMYTGFVLSIRTSITIRW
jgi:hypothetical protein